MINLYTNRSMHIYYRFTAFLLTFSLLLTFSDAPVRAQLPVIKQDGEFESPFAHVYEKVAPSVVRIDIKLEKEKISRNTRSPWDQFFERSPQREFQRPDPMGSGVIVDRDGHILTNNHVIAKASKITVKVNEYETYDAEVVGTDPESDIAVVKLKLDGKLLPPEYVAKLGDSDTLKPGDYAIAIGNPIGLERTINVGVVSALGRHGFEVMNSNSPKFQDFIQTDAQINPGNSGGALADINGMVIGINDMYTARYAGIGFAIPINLARNVMTQLISTGKVTRGFVGINADSEGITKEKQEAMNLPTKDGVLIVDVVPDYPADKAGLKRGDVIVTLNGKNVKNFQDFLFRIADYTPGDTVDLVIIRDGKIKDISLALADRSEYVAGIGAPVNSVNWRGIHVVDIDNPAAQDFDLSNIDSGVVIVKIDEGSPASVANLRPGDVIIEIETEQVTDTNNFQKIKDNISNNPDTKDKTILIFKKRRSSNGHIETGFVAVKSK